MEKKKKALPPNVISNKQTKKHHPTSPLLKLLKATGFKHEGFQHSLDPTKRLGPWK